MWRSVSEVARPVPGGVLLTEDFWPTPPSDFVACAASAEDAALIRRYQRAHLQLLSDHGNDRTWCRRAMLAFLEEGLVDVRTTVTGSAWRGGGPGCRMLIAGIGQLREELMRTGLDDSELDQLFALFGDPSVILHGHLVYSTSGGGRMPWNPPWVPLRPPELTLNRWLNSGKPNVGQQQTFASCCRNGGHTGRRARGGRGLGPRWPAVGTAPPAIGLFARRAPPAVPAVD